ncbi:30S ribosomal protein S3 [Candidatus Nitrosocosmicus sp. SS]|jgi:small subunit ribosomal protein S3|uniref:30S ribosomal protein S3 n=1 Tax=Candidatus Nitrosocosmicus agrestis TaxID=2563600 RepID=UPI00122E9EFF|nr:30S ribosomal protein S3 [Candidatus Nitrosocosmicus sp. SS]KAA2282690.1 30S ribosomal protein S3 [Candidatus Nitrosocosmicus sp. SS]KAF0867820.1 30S ribosomal protein S3 [Candidatus Nitrosocosmicus sp. SS]MDR4491065.1 30S ribosomal protein S3 [Candidatus Nitrosocosmicus sp.]
MNAIKNVLKNNYRNSELDEFLRDELKDAGFGGADIQKSPLGTRLTLYVTRPGLVIGRKGSGIRDLTSKLEVRFGLTNPQISVVEVEVPELNPKIMCNRLAQLIERGTAFRRAALWTLNTIRNAGALGVEVTISGKLRSERAHFEKHSSGIVPKSGNMADKVVKEGLTHVLTKMGIMGIRLKIAIKNATPPEFELVVNHREPNSPSYYQNNEGASQSTEEPSTEKNKNAVEAKSTDNPTEVTS